MGADNVFDSQIYELFRRPLKVRIASLQQMKSTDCCVDLVSSRYIRRMLKRIDKAGMPTA
jgi:hypothetical protein